MLEIADCEYRAGIVKPSSSIFFTVLPRGVDSFTVYYDVNPTSKIVIRNQGNSSDTITIQATDSGTLTVPVRPKNNWWYYVYIYAGTSGKIRSFFTVLNLESEHPIWSACVCKHVSTLHFCSTVDNYQHN